MEYFRDDYTKHYIVQALFRLMADYSYEKISIIDIVKKAGVGRATFYRYFKSKEDVIKFYFEHNRIQFVFNQHYFPRCKKDYETIAAQALTMFQNNKQLFKLLKNANLEYLYLEYINANFSETFSKEYSDRSPYEPYIYAGMLFNVSMKWLEDDCKEPVESLSKTIVNAVYFEQN